MDLLQLNSLYNFLQEEQFLKLIQIMLKNYGADVENSSVSGIVPNFFRLPVFIDCQALFNYSSKLFSLLIKEPYQFQMTVVNLVLKLIKESDIDNCNLTHNCIECPVILTTAPFATTDVHGLFTIEGILLGKSGMESYMSVYTQAANIDKF